MVPNLKELHNSYLKAKEYKTRFNYNKVNFLEIYDKFDYFQNLLLANLVENYLSDLLIEGSVFMEFSLSENNHYTIGERVRTEKGIVTDFSKKWLKNNQEKIKNIFNDYGIVCYLSHEMSNKVSNILKINNNLIPKKSYGIKFSIIP